MYEKKTFMSIINKKYTLTDDQIKFYEKNGFIKLKEVLSVDEITFYNDVISEKVKELNSVDIPLEQRDTYGKAFLQLFNLWEKDKQIKELIFSEKLAQIATDLMKVDGVRLYHDQALFKEPNGGITPWHADQHYWPLSSDKAITVWIPLQKTPIEMGPLEFSAGSQTILEGRELSISDESEKVIGEKVRLNNFEHIIEPFEVGEVSFHSGWVFHRAGGNSTNQTRKVMTIIYMDQNMKLKKPKNSGQLNDWNTWCPGAKINEVIQTRLNPILYSK
jgi:ectoine hydroxylase-related dioxygenase (phytanoyl-CoA dioxygenase family)